MNTQQLSATSMGRRYLIRTDGAVSGPFSLEELKLRYDSGQLSPETLIRWEKLQRWWIPTDFGWLHAVLLFRPIHSLDFRIPPRTIVVWAVIAALGLLLLVVHLLHR